MSGGGSEVALSKRGQGEEVGELEEDGEGDRDEVGDGAYGE
jgi:hypothetical protein